MTERRLWLRIIQNDYGSKYFRVVCLLLCLLAFSCETSPQKIIEKAQKSVVTIKTPSGSGSGFIASADGLIITNSHVVGNNETVEVHFPDGRTTVASPIKKGLSVLDVAYLRVDGSKFDYLSTNTNCSSGDEVYAIGAPLGLSESVSKGIISNCDRTIKGVKFIQTDAAVNAGNSGGPLINKKGEVVGLLTFKISAEGVEGLNFALAPAMVWDYYENKLTNLEEALKKEVIAQNPVPKSTSGEPSWIVVADSEVVKIEYDANNINFISKNVFDAWIMVTHKTPKPFSKRLIKKAMSTCRYDCIEKSFLVLQQKVYFVEGDTESWTPSLGKRYLESDTAMMAVIDGVCR